jgi:hypothetical protein
MTKDTWAATEVDSVIVPVDGHCHEVVIQVLTGGPIYLAFGEAAVAGKGLYLTEGGSYTIDDARVQLAVHAICGAGATASGGYQTA